MSELADARARADALDPSRSFIVQAPAGSGKTGLLTQRLLRLLATVDQPEEIIAVTFTRKAAGEMLERIVGELHGADGPAPGDPHGRKTWELARAARARDLEQGWNLADNPSRLKVQTFDSLALYLARRMPFASGLGGGPQLAEDASRLHREAARRLLGMVEDEGENGRAVAGLLAHMDNDAGRTMKQVADLLARRDQWLRHLVYLHGADDFAAYLESALVRVVTEELAGAAAALSPWSGKLAEIVTATAPHAAPDTPVAALAAWNGSPPPKVDALAGWRALTDLLLKKDDRAVFRVSVNAAQGFAAKSTFSGADAQAEAAARKNGMTELLADMADDAGLLAALAEVRELPDPAAVHAGREALAHMGHALKLAVAQLVQVFAERRQTDFVEVARGAAAALGEDDAPTDLALALDARIRHILVDEFQDTAYGQFALLTRLTAGWEPGDGRTLFLVGDPMQSIYGFREAEVGLYLRAWRDGIGAVPLHQLVLSANFRSHGPVVEWVNGTFPLVMPGRADISRGAVPYTESVAARGGDPESRVSFDALPDADADAEAALVVDHVRAALTCGGRESIAVIVRSRAHLPAIVQALAAAGIGCKAVEIDPLSDTTPVMDLAALTRALVNPADRVAWLAVLRSPMCGLTLDDLLALAGGGRKRAVCDLLADDAVRAALSADGRQRLDRVAPVLREALTRRGSGRFARLVEHAWVKLGGPAAGGPGSVAHADRFFEVLDRLEERGEPLGAQVLEDALGDLYAQPEGDAPVEVMTIHGAKGLEWDTVILPGLGRGARSDDSPLLAWMERPVHGTNGWSDLLLSPVGVHGAPDPLYRFIQQTRKEKRGHETGRLLYVAATRAKKRLHLLGHARYSQERWAPRAGSFLEKLWPRLADRFEMLDPPEAAPAARPDPPRLFRLPADYRLPAPPPRVDVPTETEQPPDDYRPTFEWAGELAPAVGTVTHRALQHIAEDGVERWDKRRVRGFRPRLVAQCISLGMGEESAGTAAGRVETALIATLGDERGRWILSPHPEARSELPVAGLVGERVEHRVIDRTFVADGVRWIVDFKTSSHEGGGLDTFLSEEQRRYTPQLEEYAALMHHLDDRPVRLGLYFPMMTEWRAWPAPGADR